MMKRAMVLLAAAVMACSAAQAGNLLLNAGFDTPQSGLSPPNYPNQPVRPEPARRSVFGGRLVDLEQHAHDDEHGAPALHRPHRRGLHGACHVRRL